MVQVQIRITIERADGKILFQYEILSREDATADEVKIAESLQSSFVQINRKAAEISGTELREVAINDKGWRRLFLADQEKPTEEREGGK